MLQFCYLTIETAIANQSGAMEADTISKNGRSLKSLMSRGIKKLIFIMITVAVGLTTACDKENAIDENVAKMTMTTAKKGLVGFCLEGTGTAVINWGDGTNETTFMDGMTQHSHTYTNSTVRTITIIGDVTYLRCGYSPHTGDIFDNQLTALDISKNAALTFLECRNNQLTTLDVSKNTALSYLEFVNNQLTTLDVSKNTALNILACNHNQLTALDVSKNTTLTLLACDNNQLTALDVSKNTMLITLGIAVNLFEAEKLNALFQTLHSNTVTIDGYTYTKSIHMPYNPGTATCNPSIAEEKGWDVDR